MKISILATIALSFAAYSLSAQEASKPNSTKEQSNSSEFRGFEPVTEDSKNMRRRSLPSAEGKKTKVPYARMALNSEYVGVALSSPDYFHWCTSPLEVDGKIHLFNARWTKSMSNWMYTSEIAQYAGDSPEGPFTYVRTVINKKE